MLSLSTLHTTLAHILAPPHLHTAILFTISGQLISYASDHGPNYPHSSHFIAHSPSTLKPKSTPPSEVYADADVETNTNVGTVGTVGTVGGGVGASGGGVGVIGGKRAVARGSRSKDDIRVLVGLGSELWGETKGAGVGMVDSEVCYSRYSYLRLYSFIRGSVLIYSLLYSSAVSWWCLSSHSLLPLLLHSPQRHQRTPRRRTRTTRGRRSQGRGRRRERRTQRRKTNPTRRSCSSRSTARTTCPGTRCVSRYAPLLIPRSPQLEILNIVITRPAKPLHPTP